MTQLPSYERKLEQIGTDNMLGKTAGCRNAVQMANVVHARLGDFLKLW